jgi:hypothetical protein
VRHRHDGHSQLRSQASRKEWRQQTADAESTDCTNTTCDQGDGNDDAIKHEA